MNEQFKAGDEVYCPRLGSIIYTVRTNDSTTFPIAALGITLKSNGIYHDKDKLSTIFHATPENKALLEALYKCEFESPKLKGSDLTRKLLSEGKHVLCYVNCHDDISAIKEHVIRIIDSIDGGIFRNKGGSGWKYAVPCNDYANLVDGVLIKSEQ